MSLVRFMPPRGTKAQADAYVGTLGELFLDTTSWQLRMSDGSTAGGHIQGGISNLIGCTDVSITAPSDGQYLSYDAASSKWKNVTLSAAWGNISGKPTTLAGYGITDVVNSILASAADLNTLITSGFYRTQDGIVNGPNGLSYGQLLVMHGGSDTITQLYGSFQDGTLWTRSGNPTNVGGTGTWSAWQQLLTTTGNGSGLTNLNASALASGVVAVGLIPTLPVGKISGLASSATTDTTNAANISSGTLLAARLPAFTGDVTSAVGTVALTIAAAAVTNAKLANMAAGTIKGASVAGAPVDLTASQVKTILAIAAADVAGIVPATGGTFTGAVTFNGANSYAGTNLFRGGAQGSALGDATAGVALGTDVAGCGSVLWISSSEALDQKFWRAGMDFDGAGTFSIQTVDDAWSTGVTAMKITRSGNSPQRVGFLTTAEFTNGEFNFGQNGSLGLAMSYQGDGWLRLNQNANFTEGLYTPGDLSVQGAIYYYSGGKTNAYLRHMSNHASGNIYVSTAAPSGGADGDIWLQYS